MAFSVFFYNNVLSETLNWNTHEIKLPKPKKTKPKPKYSYSAVSPDFWLRFRTNLCTTCNGELVSVWDTALIPFVAIACLHFHCHCLLLVFP